ncbi:MAG: hypothetical protein JW825_00870 [Candidatus Methanofastidiosa archaeon]|nr:hypothetical protein [Candidatus Methanofastidiosa archaeon]
MDRIPDAIERITIKLAGRGWHLPAYWILTLGAFPVVSYIYKKRDKGLRKLVVVALSAILMAFGAFFLIGLRLYILYALLVTFGRIGNLLNRAISGYRTYGRPSGNGLRALPLFYYSVQSIFIRLYGQYFKIPFIVATTGFGPIVLFLWERGRVAKAISILASLAGLVSLVAIGYGFALLFIAIGLLMFLLILIVKKVGGSEDALHTPAETERAWDKAGIAFLAIISFSFIFNMGKFSPNVIDLWYHLAISRKILELGTIPIWDFWEFAPAGRPHLYPPLSHLLIAFISRDPENVLQGGKVLQAFTYPLTLLTTWYMARRFFGSKVASLSIFILSIDMGVMLISTMALPSSLVTVMLPILVLTFVQKRAVPSIILMTAMLYAHLSFPFVVMFTLLIISMKYREYMRMFTIVSSVSLALYLPWLFRVLTYQGALESTTSQLLSIRGLFVGLLSLQIVNPILLALGIIAFMRMDGTRMENRIVKMVIIGTLPILLFYGGRYWLHMVPFWAVCIAIVFKDRFASRKSFALLAIAMIFPTVSIVTMQWPPIMINLTGSDAAIFLWANEDGIFFDKQYDIDCEALASYLEANLPEDAIVSSDIEWVPDMIVTLTNLRTNQGAWWEVKSDNDFVLPDAFISFEEMQSSDKIGRFYVTLDKDIIAILLGNGYKDQ